MGPATRASIQVRTQIIYYISIATLLTYTGVRVEWTKARSRCHRWREEILLLPEEMRRTIAYHRRKAQWWRERANLRLDTSPALREGLSAYANRQASIRNALADRAEVMWTRTLHAVLKTRSGTENDAQPSATSTEAACNNTTDSTWRSDMASDAESSTAQEPSARFDPTIFDPETFDPATFDPSMFDFRALNISGVDSEGLVDGEDDESDDEGVQELEESEAVVAYMELDLDYGS